MRFGSCHALLALRWIRIMTEARPARSPHASADVRKRAFGTLRATPVRPKADRWRQPQALSTISAPMNRLMLDYNVLYVVLVAAGLVFFGAVFLSTRPAQRAKPVKIDAWMGREVVWFAVVVVILVGSLAATIGHTPWSASAEPGRQIVQVTSVQYGFKFSTTTMQVGRQVEFHLKATDVNHGFAVFDPGGTFIAQAQMVPGYDTVVRLTFTEPGRYTVRCFEYCGIGHAAMVGEFRVHA
jgi:cytochrome c oxidase subunit 2